MENIIMAVFPVESEAYQAFSELKRDSFGSSFLVGQAALVKKEGASLRVCESFDSGLETADDTWSGTLIGSIVGILGGPIGVLLGAGIGGLTGAAIDAADISRNGSLLEKAAANLSDGTVAILALTQEDGTMAMDSKFMKYNADIQRFDAAEVQAELDAARKAQREMEKQTRAALRQEKAEAGKAKYAEIKTKLSGDFEALKSKVGKK